MKIISKVKNFIIGAIIVLWPLMIGIIGLVIVIAVYNNPKSIIGVLGFMLSMTGILGWIAWLYLLYNHFLDDLEYCTKNRFRKKDSAKEEGSIYEDLLYETCMNDMFYEDEELYHMLRSLQSRRRYYIY